MVGGSRCRGFSRSSGRDRLFDYPADFVDGGVELLLPVEKFAARWFSDGGDHAEADVT